LSYIIVDLFKIRRSVSALHTCMSDLLYTSYIIVDLFKISISSAYMYVRFIVHLVYGGVIIVRLMSMRIHQWFRTLF